MAYIARSSLFHKKSKASLKSTDPEDEKHMRKFSTSSSISASTESSRHRHDRLNPLSLHPPMSFNTSPHVAPEHDLARYEEEDEREARFFNQTRYAHDHIQDLSEYSPVKGENCYFDGPETRSYLRYRDSEEWPLKNWQIITPALSESSSANSSVASSPTLPETPRRRNADWINDRDVFIKRGAWKRQGIVFGLHEDDEQWQEKHFELPLPSD